MRDALADQRAILTDILHSGTRSTPLWRPGSASAEEILDLHRQTVFGGLTNTLGLIFPTVHRLVGVECFEQVAHQYIASHPPSSPVLSEYGEAFPDFIAANESCSTLLYLKNVATFDLILDRVSHHEPGRFSRPVVLEECADIRLDLSLRCFAVDYPVDSIREAIESEREDLLSSIDMTPSTRYFSAWMGSDGVRLRPIGSVAYAFIGWMHDTLSSTTTTKAVASIDMSSSTESIENDVLLAPYSRISMHTSGLTPP